jgi:formylglycine-generating enzyme
MVWVPGGTFVMGSDEHHPEETPSHGVEIDGFWMDHTGHERGVPPLVDATGHVTLAERASPCLGWSR